MSDQLTGAAAADDVPVVLVTGASGGVGRGIAIAAGRTGATVWVAARREAEGAAVAREVDQAGGTGRFVACDVADEASVRAAVSAVLQRDGRLNAVIHNATSGESPKPVPLPTLPLADFRDHLSVSLTGSWLLARASYRALADSSGSFILLTSEAGFEGKRGLPAYATVKAAQRGFARALAREWGPAGITVNCVAPLAMTPAMDRAFTLDPAMEKRVTSRIPLGRVGSPEDDIGPAVVALIGPHARYLTGNTLMVDGGSCPIT
jgi:3-oxoacyl-[acyl-carrier protein] reductase